MNEHQPAAADAAFLEKVMRYQDGAMPADEVAAFEEEMREDAAKRRAFAEAQLRSMALHERFRQDAFRVVPKPERVAWFPSFAWRPLTAAAAGLIIGLFCATVAWAFVAPSSGKVIALMQESFESGPSPLVVGVPTGPGKWSGDFSGVVGELEGVKPASGKKMLRFLRGDYEGRSIPSSHSSDLFRLVDVRPYQRELVGGGAVVQLTAVFNAVSFSEDETFNATLTLFALDAGLVGNEMVKGDNVLSTESLAFSRSSKVVMDRDPATWQKVSNELRLPAGTEFLMLRIGMSNDTKSKDKRRDSFAGHFADKVQLVLARRAEIPVP